MMHDDPRHGTTNGYTNLGCRCQPCRDANAVAHLEYMHRAAGQSEKHRLREADRYAALRSTAEGRAKLNAYSRKSGAAFRARKRALP